MKMEASVVFARPFQQLRPSAETTPQNRIPTTPPAVKLSAVKAAAPLDFIRFKKHVLRLQIGERGHAASASNSSPSGGDSNEDKPGRGFWSFFSYFGLQGQF